MAKLTDAGRLQRMIYGRTVSKYLLATTDYPQFVFTQLRHGDLAALRRILKREQARERGKEDKP